MTELCYCLCTNNMLNSICLRPNSVLERYSFRSSVQPFSPSKVAGENSWIRFYKYNLKNNQTKPKQRKPCEKFWCKYIFAPVYLFMQAPLYCFGELWGQLYECWAKELEFPVHFYFISFCTMWHKKCNTIEEVQQCSLIEAGQKVSMEAYAGNVFVSSDSGELNIC